MSRAATSRLKVNPPIGAKPELEWVPINKLSIDPAYQRSIQASASQTLIRRIAQFWDWNLCQPLTAARRVFGPLKVVDGQHRLAAARLRGDIDHLPCVITAYASVGDEAAAFVALNQQRRPLGALDLFKAALAAEDADARAIMAMMERCELSLAPHMNYVSWKPGMVSNISGIQARYRAHGARIAEDALSVLARAFAGHVLRYAGTIFPGIAVFLAEQERYRHATDLDLLARTLAAVDQAAWVKRIKIKMVETGERRDTAARRVVAEAYAENLSRSEVAAVPLAPPRLSRPNRSFEEQMEAVRNGARLVEHVPIRRPDPDRTLGGVTGEIM